ncbi:hypothetical protein [Salinispora sp. H7-4]|uniref:hypothetical protein n=1 Tax=Salinispora sp. H7-4 TaxID=2748321 RepID=UPI001C554E07|nr:hypothetical protein [Salinispora sp. H7-4]
MEHAAANFQRLPAVGFTGERARLHVNSRPELLERDLAQGVGRRRQGPRATSVARAAAASRR